MEGFDKVYLKLTTVPQNMEVHDGDKELQIYQRKYENYTDDIKIVRDTANHYIENAAKNPLFGKIRSISIGYVLDDTVRIKILEGEEKTIITKLLNDIAEYFPKSTIVTWNNRFTLPYITTRMMCNNIGMETLPIGLKHLGLREWNLKKNKGLQSFLEGVGWFKGSLEQWAYNLGLETDLIDGADVHKYVLKNDFAPLQKSDVDYVYTMVQLDRVSEGKGKIPNVNFLIDNLYGKEEEVQPIEDNRTVLEKLYDSNQLTDSIQEEIKKLKGKKRLTKKDRENMYTILRGVLVRCDFVNNDQDTKAVIQEKEEAVRTFINNL